MLICLSSVGWLVCRSVTISQKDGRYLLYMLLSKRVVEYRLDGKKLQLFDFFIVVDIVVNLRNKLCYNNRCPCFSFSAILLALYSLKIVYFVVYNNNLT